MADELRLQGYREPLGLWLRRTPAPAAYPELRAFRFEYSSRGDRVGGRLWLPHGPGGPYPLVLLQHGAGGSSESPYLEATGGPWAQRGAAVASIDLPLHGARGDAKLAGRLTGAFVGSGETGLRGLLVEFARQSVIDLERAVDALAAHGEVATERTTFVGFSLGAMLGAAFCALDPRPRAAVLALGGAGLAPAGVDPAEYVGRFAPRPLLLVNAERDARIPAEAARALARAARPPVEQIWFDATHDALPGNALKAMWAFLEPHLELRS